MAPGLAAAGALLLGAGIWMGRRVVRVYEHGIVENETRLAFDDVTDLVAEVVVHIGSAAGTDYSFVIIGQGTNGRVRISFSSGNLGTNTKTATSIIRAISQPITKRMQESIDHGDSIPWGSHGSISKEHFQFSGEAPIPLSSIVGFDLNNAVLTITTSERRRVTMNAKENNFFPGYFLVQGMLPQKRIARLTNPCLDD